MKKKNPGDFINLHKCTKNHDHLLYCSRDMAHDGCNYFHFGLSGIFPSTSLQPVNGYKNSILNWVIKLSLIKLPMKFYSSKKNCCCCRQTMHRLCFYSQRERWKQIFQQYGDLKLKKFCFGAHLGAIQGDTYLNKE